MLEPSLAEQKPTLKRDAFVAKRDVLVEQFAKVGVGFAAKPGSTLYAWGCPDGWPAQLNNAKTFRRALERRVMTVLGERFDVNSDRRRSAPSPYSQWMRFSFASPRETLEALVNRAR